ncbi:hypothetical protein L1987_23192 [Smallanthus sonchifolius]|uniref:Uncharacterized protein n=1 Tax=Smallanthus sonchifolius TaxID=185202 RepID=A0ACB9IJL4_9ASTR|nr:hypothetical protein L1987_23192 [Smallanthus sonchifolius]
MITTMPKGYDFENYLSRLARDGFKGIKNPNVAKKNLKRYSYSVENVEDTIAISEKTVAYKSKDEFEAKDFNSIIKKLANRAKGLPEDD